jgi:hypothetical protein
MVYPNVTRVTAADFLAFFAESIKPSLPDARAMRNGSPDTPLRGEMSAELLRLVVANSYHSLLLGIR